jgi:hypothetical protein
MGGSQDVDSNASCRPTRTSARRASTRRARGAAASLDQQREQERLNAISLVNSGAGESAVAAAQRGLRNSLQNVSTAESRNLFNDLFTNGADAYSAQAQNAALAAQLRPLQPALSYFYPASGGSTGRITPSGG